MFGVGMPELMVIFVIALLVFGPKELPKIARTLGKAMAELRRASDELRDGVQREIDLATREESEPAPVTPEPVPSAESIPATATAENSQGTISEAVGAEAAGHADPQIASPPPPSEHEGTVEGPPTPVQLTIPAISLEPGNGGEKIVESGDATVQADAPPEAVPKTETLPLPPAHPAGTPNA